MIIWGCGWLVIKRLVLVQTDGYGVRGCADQVFGGLGGWQNAQIC